MFMSSIIVNLKTFSGHFRDLLTYFRSLSSGALRDQRQCGHITRMPTCLGALRTDHIHSNLAPSKLDSVSGMTSWPIRSYTSI